MKKKAIFIDRDGTLIKCKVVNGVPLPINNIDQFKFNQPEILFTEDNSLVFFTGKGEIFKTSTDFEEYWKVNHIFFSSYTISNLKQNYALYCYQKLRKLT